MWSRLEVGLDPLQMAIQKKEMGSRGERIRNISGRRELS